jgi:ribonuclease D
VCPSYIYTDDDAALNDLVGRMKDAEKIALDTEADSLHHYYEKVCLIQISIQRKNYIVDPLSGIDLTAFLKVLSKKPLILHGADYDLRILRATFGFKPSGTIFDTMLAAQLLGYPHLGLSALVQHFFDVTLKKKSQRFNWSIRPLPETELVYASDDTRFLEPLWKYLFKELEKLNRDEWHRETCLAMVNAALADREPSDPEEEWRIKGMNTLRPKEMAFVRKLWYWREKTAQDSDLPPFKILRNNQLIGLALWAASHPDAPIERGPKLPRHIRGQRLKNLKSALRRAANIPRAKWPRHRKRKFNPPSREDQERIDSLRNTTARLAKKLGIYPSVLAPRAAIESIVRSRSKEVDRIMATGRLTRWQAETLKPSIDKILNDEAD